VREIAVVVAAYLIGSVPSAYLASRFLAGADPRRVGSSSMGGMNVLRNVGVLPGVLTAVGDVAKGYVAVRLASAAGVSPLAVAAAGIAAVAGHDWMLFMGFRGGKGIATSLGAYLAMLPWAALVLAVAIGAFSLLLRDAYGGTTAGFWATAAALAWAGRLAKGDARTVFSVGAAVLATVKFAPDAALVKRLKRR
jgi:glycerol-3-phosphate acyltransferase PlsY